MANLTLSRLLGSAAGLNEMVTSVIMELRVKDPLFAPIQYLEQEKFSVRKRCLLHLHEKITTCDYSYNCILCSDHDVQAPRFSPTKVLDSVPHSTSKANGDMKLPYRQRDFVHFCGFDPKNTN